MSNSYRIRTQVGVDKSLKVLLDQDFEFLEVLSLKILQSQIYTRPCSDYGVIIGRVTANDGFGIPNAKVSVFIPLSPEDGENPIIADLYPYKTLTDLNEDGYRYNLLPYTQQHSGHNPTGTFFDREDVLTDPTLIQVFDKYYKYTARTNESGDYMIFGVPVGSQTLHIDIDLSDIGEFSLSPQDLIRMGVATQAQVAGTKFKSSSNLNELPQIISINRTIEVDPLWGQSEICNIGITRTDFDLTAEANITITPTAIFMGSLISSNDDQFQKKNCKPKIKQGNLCNLVAGPGEILSIRQTIQQDINGRPVLETFSLEQGGQVIDENGTWLVDVPMNLDYVITNEFGERVLSDDPKKGIPTKGKYRFKVKWNQEPTLNEAVKRGYFLVPNVKEWGWQNSGSDPLISSTSTNEYDEALKSYAFSLDWEDYGNPLTPIGLQMIQEAIDCEDRFYPMEYNKVYSVSQLIDQYRKGYLPNRMVSIKNILDDACESENVKFPTNDAILRFDLVYLLFTIMLFIFKPIIYILLVVVHILAWLLKYILGPILAIIVAVVFIIIIIICYIIYAICFGCLTCPDIEELGPLIDTMLNLYKYFTNIPLPNLSYSDCELCDCNQGESPFSPGGTDPSGTGINVDEVVQNSGINSKLSQYTIAGYYTQSLLTTTFSFPLIISELFAGKAINNNTPTANDTVPQLLEYDNGSDRYIFTNSLTISERLNLFNNKSKYFNNDNTNNPGGGVNRIRVTFESNTNISPTSEIPLPIDKWHLDNVIAISVVPSQLQYFTEGKLISFQDPLLSQDVNLTGFTSWNQFGTASMTGTPININASVQISYANPNGAGTISPSNSLYTITQDSDDASYHKFGMDIEYFQVITGMTYSTFSSNSNPANIYSLNNRFLDNDILWNLVEDDGCWISSGTSNPLSYFENYQNQGIVFLVRGVDPNTSRRQHSYDLSVLFGYNFYHNSGQFVVTGDYKMNIPIQGSYKSVSHTNMILDTTITDTSNGTGLNLYYDSFHFQPASVGNASFTAFTSNLPSYYSKLDSTSSTFTPTGAPGNLSLPCNFNLTYGARIKPFATLYNGFTIQYTNLVFTIPSCDFYSGGTNPITETKGYFINEIVEGGSVFLQNSSVILGGPITQTGFVYSPRYSGDFNFINNVTSVNNQIVMRSDRLPTSTSTTDIVGNSFALHGNINFAIYYLEDDGTSLNEPQSQNTPQTNDPNETIENNADLPDANNVLQTFSCGGMIPLGCYSGGTNEVSFYPKPNDCYGNDWNDDNREIMENGCYILVTSILGTLINGKDFEILSEWISRIQITFGACRNVWSHVFTNNWINGTLYAFAFKNDRFFTQPTDTPPNFPFSVYCRDTVFLHPTNNFYYRSSPYNENNGFIGSNPPSPSPLFPNLPGYGGNSKNLKYPTTIIDLGPRTFYLQELVMSDDYDGYVANRLNDTTYTDTDEILNLFILSRLLNTGFLQQLLGTGGANILNYFDQRSKFFVDGDYAQMISISSELGISDFEAANYPTNPSGQDPIYFSNSDSTDVIIGIFFSSDTQVRDFITPKRTIISPTSPSTDSCAFNSFNVFSQKVPFYQWSIKQSDAGASQDSIFGSQKNDWYTQPLTTSFLTNRYQSMDRLLQSSRYFRTNGNTQTQYFKGYIYSVTPTGEYNPAVSSQDPNTAPYSINERIVTVGAPQHFYFGLKKGKTAFDRFSKQWINFEVITD